MSVDNAEELLSRSQALRAELKAWEVTFAAASNGRKAGREDIKKNAPIASKYKEYRSLRDILSGKQPRAKEPSAGPSPPKKRKTTQEKASGQMQTPKRERLGVTPSKPAHHPAALDPYDSPSVIRKLQYTPSHRVVVGPTPQRDGKVLGLFDIIDEDEDEEPDQSGQTPSRSRVLRDSSQNTHRTPRKPLAEEEIVTPLRYGKTPTSSSKRFLLDMFVTPSKRKAAADHELDGDEDVTTTPAFLRREYYHHHDHHRHSSNHHKAVRYDENGNLKMDAPSAPVVVPVRRPAKPPVRGLSSIIAGLRKMEEERLDEELDILRELENERTPAAAAAAGLPPHSLVGEKKPSMTMNDSAKASTEAGGAEVDSLTNNNDNDDDDDENIKSNQAEQPSGSSKPWKKRGQKRTNKKVLIRPSRLKKTPLTDPHHHHHHDDDDKNHNDGEQEEKPHTTATAAAAPRKKKISANAHAHANFRRLKIRNRNSSGAGGGGGRNGRRWGGRRR